MSKIVLEFQGNNYPLDEAPYSFNHLMEIVEEKVGKILPNVYKMYVVDEDGDEITISSKQDLETNIQYFLERNQNNTLDMIIHIKESDLNKSGFCLRSADDSQNASEIRINQSIQDQKKRVEQLKEQIKMQNQKIQQKEQKYQVEEKQQQAEIPQILQESIFQRSDKDLSISQIMEYYKNILSKYEENFKAQTFEHRLNHQEVYRKNYDSMLKRLQIKLQSHFDELLKVDFEQAKFLKEQQEKLEMEQAQKVENPVQPQPEKQKQPQMSEQEKQILDKAQQIAAILDMQYEQFLNLVKNNLNDDINTLVGKALDSAL